MLKNLFIISRKKAQEYLNNKRSVGSLESDLNGETPNETTPLGSNENTPRPGQEGNKQPASSTRMAKIMEMIYANS